MFYIFQPKISKKLHIKVLVCLLACLLIIFFPAFSYLAYYLLSVSRRDYVCNLGPDA